MADTKPRSWAKSLRDSREIAQYIEKNSPAYVDVEFAEEYFFECSAVLRVLPVSAVEEGPQEANIPSKSKAARYRKQPLETAPPIVIMDGTVQDGHHRLRDAKARGATHILCYVVEPNPEPLLDAGNESLFNDTICGSDTAISHLTPSESKFGIGDASSHRNFAGWFGNSVVTESTGAPLVVFHGTATEGTTYNTPPGELPTKAFRSFDVESCGSVTQSSDARAGFWFTSSLKRAQDAARDALDAKDSDDFSSYVYRVFLQVEQPLVLGRVCDYEPSEVAHIAKLAKVAGHDGIVFSEGEYGPPDYLVFSNLQIKSAESNSGLYRLDSPDITDGYDELKSRHQNAARAIAFVAPTNNKTKKHTY